MYQNLELFQTAGAMARHAGSRQAVVAQNVANADTPHFRALEMPSFQETYKRNGAVGMNATRPGHLHGGDATATQVKVTESRSEPAPNGNSVSVEDEMLHAVAVSREHNRALAIYRHGMTVLRSAIGR